MLERERGQRVALADLIKAGLMDSLQTLVEAAFRAQRGLSADAAFDAAGFQFPENSFTLPENMAFGADGLLFYYNYYEVAPRVFGPTKVVIPWERARGLLREQ